MAQRYLLALDYADVRARHVLLKHMKNRALGELETRHRYVPLQPAISFRTVDVDVGAFRGFHPRLASDIIDEQHSLIHELANNKRKAASAPLGGRPVGRTEPHYKLKKLYHVQFGRERSASRQSSRTNVRARPKSSAAPSRAAPATPGGRETRSAATTPREEFLQHQRELTEISREHKLCKRKIAQRLRDHFNQRKVAISQGIYIRGKSTPGRADSESWLVFAGAQHKEADGVVGAFTMMDDAEEFYNIDGGVGSSVAEKLKKGDKIRIGINGVVQSHSLKVSRPVEDWPPESAEQEEERKEKLDDSGDIDALERKLNELMQEEEEREAGGRRPVVLQPLSWEDQLNEANVKIVTPRRASPVRETASQFESHPVIFEKVVRDIPAHPKLPSEHFQGYRVNTRNFNPKKPPGWGDGQKVNVVTVDNTSQQMMEDLSVLSVDEVIRSALLASQLSRSPSPEAAAEAPRSESSVSGKRRAGSAYSERVPSSATPEPGFMAARLVRPSAPSISQSRPSDLSITAPGTVLGKTHLDAAKRKNVIPPKSPMSPRVPPKIAYTSGAPAPYQGSEYIKIATQISPGLDSRQGTPNVNHNHHSASASFDERNVKLMSDRDYISQLMREQTEESVDFGGKPSSPASLRSESPPAMIGLPAHSPTPLAAPSLSPPWEAPLSPPPPKLRVNIPTAAEEQSDCQHADGGEELTGPQRREKNLRDAHIEDITSLLAGAIPPGSRLAH